MTAPNDTPPPTGGDKCTPAQDCQTCINKLPLRIMGGIALALLVLHYMGFPLMEPLDILFALLGASCLIQIHHLARGMWGRYVCGLIGTGLCIAGFLGFFICGDLLIDFITRGGAAWFAAVTMACCGLIGILCAGIFGYLLLHFMEKRLWLATGYFSMILFTLGTYLNSSQGQRFKQSYGLVDQLNIEQVVDPSTQQEQALGFTLQLTAPEKEHDTRLLATLTTKRSKEEQRLQIGDTLCHQSWEIELQELRSYPEGHAVQLTFDYQPGRFLVRGGSIALFFSMLACLFWNKISKKNTRNAISPPNEHFKA